MKKNLVKNQCMPNYRERLVDFFNSRIRWATVYDKELVYDEMRQLLPFMDFKIKSIDEDGFEDSVKVTLGKWSEDFTFSWNLTNVKSENTFFTKYWLTKIY